MTPEDLAGVVRAAVAQLQAEGALTGDLPEEIVIERPRSKEHGDYATPVALTLAKSADQIQVGDRVLCMGIGSGLNTSFTEIVW